MEIVHVMHKIAAVRDEWSLKLTPEANILNTTILSVILDFEKEM